MERIGIVLGLALLLLPAGGSAQISGRLELGNECSMFGEVLPSDVVLFDSEEDAEEAITRIVRAVGIFRNFTVRAAGVPNAAAAIQGDQRFVLYDPYFMRNVRQQTGSEWGALSILAHEIGHHVNGHTLRTGGSRPDTELEADYYSGFVVARMGGTLDQARLAMQRLGSDAGTNTHPARRDRLVAITQGWNAAGARTPAPAPEPDPDPDPEPEPEPPVPEPAPPRPRGLPAGTVIAQCGCWGFAQPGQVAANAQCASGQMVAQPCPGWCPAGGLPWGTVCN